MTICHCEDISADSARLVSLKDKPSSVQKLRLAARKLFVGGGYDKTRPQDIAREAGLANGTFYLHFSDKKEAFLDFAEEVQAELLEEFRVRLEVAEGSKNRWSAIFSAMESYDVKNPGALEVAFLDPVLIAPQNDDAWRLYDRMSQFVSLLLKENSNDFSSNYNLEMVSHAICGMMRHAMIYARRKGIARDKMISDLTGLIDKGLFG